MKSPIATSLLILLMVFGLSACQTVPKTDDLNGSPVEAKAGHLLIVGGALRSSSAAIYERFIELAEQGGEARFVIVPAASSRPQRSAAAFRDDLIAYGVRPEAIEILPLATLDDTSTAEVDESTWAENGDSPKVVEAISRATAVWFVGGDQTRITAVFSPEGRATAALDALWQGYRERGIVIGGTSAGAAIQSDPMLAGGASLPALLDGVLKTSPSSENQEAGLLSLQPGLGFFPEGLIDQHFDRKSRLGRLIVALAEADVNWGWGIDEDTALLYDAHSRQSAVLGSGGVTLLDRRAMTGQAPRFDHLRLSYLTAGDQWDHATDTFTPDSSKAPTKADPYWDFAQPEAHGLLTPYSGRLGDVLGFLLSDNSAQSTVSTYAWLPSSSTIASMRGLKLSFWEDTETRGYWAAIDGSFDLYSVFRVRVSAQPVQVTLEEVAE